MPALPTNEAFDNSQPDVTDKHPKIKTSSAVFFIQAKIAKKTLAGKILF